MSLKQILKKIKLSEKTISAVLGALVVVVVGVLLFNFFRTQGGKPEGDITPGGVQEEASESVERDLETLPTTHVVSEGENLWEIAEQYYDSGYNWVDIAQENNLARPDYLAVSQELTIPDVEVRRVEEEKPTAEIENYTVQEGDSLWKISVKIYNDGYQWTRIYEANRDQIGSNPSLIEPGLVLDIPID